MASRQQLLCHLRGNESGNAGYEVCRHKLEKLRPITSEKKQRVEGLYVCVTAMGPARRNQPPSFKNVLAKGSNALALLCQS